MDSFSQQMLDSVERRTKTYQLSNGVEHYDDDDCDAGDIDGKEKENLTNVNQNMSYVSKVMA